MKLSMTIIENWIQKYHPVSTIISDKPTIAGVRLFSYNKNPSPDFLYIGRNRDFFEQSESDEILLVHRKDVISLKTQELEDVLDTVMDAFAFYQEWEQQMLSAFQKENPEQVIIDACKTVFGPMFYTNMSLQITAFSRQYPENSINENIAWNKYSINATNGPICSVPTLIILLAIQNNTIIAKLSSKKNVGWAIDINLNNFFEILAY